MKKDTGGFAFPFQPTSPQGEPYSPDCGMTLRDYFAGQVLSGLINGSFTHLGQEFLKSARDQGFAKGAGGVFAKSAYEYADAMIEERSKK